MSTQTEIIGDSPTVSTNSVETLRPRYARRRIVFVLLCVGLGGVGWGGYRLWTMHTGLDRARLAMERKQWLRARHDLDGYLRLHPHDAEAHLLMAEAFIKESSSVDSDHDDRAIHHLQQIPDDSPQAATARLQEARLALLLKRQPARAEALLRTALRLNPDSYDANLLMWKLLDLTDRHAQSRDFFWQTYELSPPPQRALRLRDWYFSEFYPEIANAPFLRAIGAAKAGNVPARIALLVRFREREPETSYLHAALARYYLEAGNRNSSLELLKEVPNLQRAMRDPEYVSVLFATLVDMGEFQRAQQCFDQWPQPHEGYLYWRALGIFHQQVRKNAPAAVRAYREALTTWPAKFDWHLMMNLGECLRKTGQLEDAQRLKSRVDYLTLNVLTNEKTTWLRTASENLRNPQVAAAMREFYREFGLMKESNAWNEYLNTLPRTAPTTVELKP